jgi:hypothetical protein
MNLLTAKVVKINDINNPQSIILQTMTPILINSEVETTSGSAPLKAASDEPKSRLAMTPDHRPCLAAVARKGRIM